MVLNLTLFILGLCMLWLGADWFIKGGRLVAESMGISPLIIGLTLGAIGTSMPELIVSGMASAVGNSGISIGNVVGSNMANIGLALGLGALIFPIPVEKNVIKFDYWILLGSGVLFYVFIRNEQLTRMEGIILIALFILFIAFMTSRHYFSKYKSETELGRQEILRGLKFFLIGGIGLAVGAKFVVDKASQIALMWGMTETVIGITVVAVGTTLPEIAVVVAGSVRKQPEISLGTIIGSNIINILLVVGCAGIITNTPILPKDIPGRALPVILFTILLLPIIATNRKIKRFEGGVLLFAYISYIYFIVK